MSTAKTDNGLPANVKNIAAKKPAAKAQPKPATPNATLRPGVPVAPAAQVNITGMADTGLNVLYALAASAPEPIRSATQSPATGLGLASLHKRGIAEMVGSGSQSGKVYTLSGAGRALVSVLWPDGAKPAAKAKTAKQPAKTPAAKAPAKAEPDTKTTTTTLKATACPLPTGALPLRERHRSAPGRWRQGSSSSGAETIDSA